MRMGSGAKTRPSGHGESILLANQPLHDTRLCSVGQMSHEHGHQLSAWTQDTLTYSGTAVTGERKL